MVKEVGLADSVAIEWSASEKSAKCYKIAKNDAKIVKNAQNM